MSSGRKFSQSKYSNLGSDVLSPPGPKKGKHNAAFADIAGKRKKKRKKKSSPSTWNTNQNNTNQNTNTRGQMKPKNQRQKALARATRLHGNASDDDDDDFIDTFEDDDREQRRHDTSREMSISHYGPTGDGNIVLLERTIFSDTKIVQKDTETSHPRPQVDALEWLPGSQSKSHGQFLGICFKDGIRYKCMYYSAAEKAHIECSELADHGFFTEAGVRLPWVNGRRPEGRNLIRRVQEGLDAISGKFDHETPLESFQRKSKNCVEMTQDFDEDTANKGFEKLTALIEERERVIVPQFDFFERTGGNGYYEYTINKEWSHYQEGWKGVEQTWQGETTYGGCGNIMDYAGMAVTQKSGLIQGTLCKEYPVNYQAAEPPPYEAPAYFTITIRSRDHVFDDASDLVFGEITIPHADIDKFKGSICKPLWQCEWSMAPNEMLLQTAQNWLMIPQAFQLAGRGITETDRCANKIQMICSALVERTEFNLAIKVAKSLLPFDLTAYGPGWFLCMLAECSEVVGNRKQAFAYYKRIETLDAISLKSKYPNDTYGCEGNNMEQEFAKVYVKLPEGTLEERLERTHQALSAPDYDTGGRRRSRPYAGTPIVQEWEQKKSTQEKKKEKKKKHQQEEEQQEEQKPKGSIFVPGSKWCIRNLTSEKGQVLNGQIATVVAHKTGKTRICVTVDGKNFKIMPDNLIPLEEATAAAASETMSMALCVACHVKMGQSCDVCGSRDRGRNVVQHRPLCKDCNEYLYAQSPDLFYDDYGALNLCEEKNCKKHVCFNCENGCFNCDQSYCNLHKCEICDDDY